MNSLTQWMDRTWYPSYTDRWDDDVFRGWVLDYLRADFQVLDLGAGAGVVEQMNFKGRAARICGVDLDPRVLSNPLLSEAKIGDAASIPYGDSEFDLVYSDNVLEHLADPEQVFREVNRVLKRGGIFLFKTPNVSHYMPLIARMTPHWFHEVIAQWRGRAASDTFPTRYRANTKRAIELLSRNGGFSIDKLERMEGRPEYLRMSPVTYPMGLIYERIVNCSDWFSCFRILLIGALRKEMAAK